MSAPDLIITYNYAEIAEENMMPWLNLARSNFGAVREIKESGF